MTGHSRKPVTRLPAGRDYLARAQCDRVVSVVATLGFGIQLYGNPTGYAITFVAEWNQSRYALVTRLRPGCIDSDLPADLDLLGDYLRIRVVGLWTPTRELRLVGVPGLLGADHRSRVSPACIMAAVGDLARQGFVVNADHVLPVLHPPISQP